VGDVSGASVTRLARTTRGFSKKSGAEAETASLK
jgi:hypothetical protein